MTARKPTKLHVLHGTDRPSRVPPWEPHAAPGDVEPPDDLDADVLVVWQSLAPELIAAGLLAPRNAISFRLGCEAVVNAGRAMALVLKTGPVVRSARGDGDVVSNPASREARHWSREVRAFAIEFGLTPLSTSAIGKNLALAGMAEREHNPPSRLLS